MSDTQETNKLVQATLDKLSSAENIANWTDLDDAIGQLGTIAGLMANNANTMTTVMDILGKLSTNPHHHGVTIRHFAIVLDNIMSKNFKHIPMGVEMIEKMVKNLKNNGNSLAALYQTLGNNFAMMTPDYRGRAMAVLNDAPLHPGATPVSISVADSAVPPILLNTLSRTSER